MWLQVNSCAFKSQVTGSKPRSSSAKAIIGLAIVICLVKTKAILQGCLQT